MVNDLPIGRDIDELLRLVGAIKYTDENPTEGCPMGWKKGKKNIKTSVEGSKEYFNDLE
jgi:peroxiredoxin 2/4